MNCTQSLDTSNHTHTLQLPASSPSAIKVTHLENWIPRVYRFRVHSPSCQSFEAWWWRGRGLTNLIFVRSLGYNGFIMTTDSEHFDGRTWKEFWLCCFYTTLAPPSPSLHYNDHPTPAYWKDYSLLSNLNKNNMNAASLNQSQVSYSFFVATKTAGLLHSKYHS